EELTAPAAHVEHRSMANDELEVRALALPDEIIRAAEDVLEPRRHLRLAAGSDGAASPVPDGRPATVVHGGQTDRVRHVRPGGQLTGETAHLCLDGTQPPVEHLAHQIGGHVQVGISPLRAGGIWLAAHGYVDDVTVDEESLAITHEGEIARVPRGDDWLAHGHGCRKRKAESLAAVQGDEAV